MEDSILYVLSVAQVPFATLVQEKQVKKVRKLPKGDRKTVLDGKSPAAVPVSRNAWLFQSNPTLYDLRGALRSLKEQVWSVSRYAKEVKAGDQVYLWEAGREGGIAAVAEISEPPHLQPEPPEQLPFARVSEVFAGERVRARLRILSVIEPLIARQRILSCPDLNALDVLRCSRGTNFRLSVGESYTIDALIQSASQIQSMAA